MKIDTRFAIAMLTRTQGLLLAVLLVTSGCAGSAWQQALEADSPSGYYRFMRENGDSPHLAEARERLEFHKLYRAPSLAGFDTFRRRYPESALTEGLYPVLQHPAFDAARAAGTERAYRDFLETFGDGEYGARAEGNALFVAAAGFGGDPVELADFALWHPSSDFAAEAKRTVEAVESRRRVGFDRVHVVIDVAEDQPERARVRAALIDRIATLAGQGGLALTVEADELGSGAVGEVVASSRLAAASIENLGSSRLEVTHVEETVGLETTAGELARPARLGQTRVVLRDRAGGEVIAQRTFEMRVADKAHVTGSSVLFSANSAKYWNEFFIPVARWRNDRAIRPPIALARPVVDLDGVGERVAVLYEDGDFDLVGLEDPTRPVTLARYDRSEGYEKWSGIRVLGARVVIYGEEGLEVVRFTQDGPQVERSWGRGEIGRVLSLTAVGREWLIVGAKGMQRIDPETGAVQQVMRRVVESIASVGDTLVFVDGESVYLSTLALLAENRVIAQMKLGRTFGPEGVRVLDGAALITGPGGALVLDVRDPKRPRTVAKLTAREFGEVTDATRLRGRTFLVGERGLQLLSLRLDRVEETLDVGARSRVSVMGRHLVAADRDGIQVVDSTPWAVEPVPASPGTASGEGGS